MAIWFAAGCATTQEPPELLIYRTCEGEQDYVQIHTTYTWFPTIECARRIGAYEPLQGVGMLAGIALACSWRIGHEGYIVLPMAAPDAFKKHERGHITGLMEHPTMMPWAEAWCEVKS